jgi:uncharacterized tellurite resistance protein B-like protein
MLNKIRSFFEKKIAPEADDEGDQKLRLAAAALLVEMARQDDQVDCVEISAIKHALRTQFELEADECDELLALAEKEVADAVDYYQFTSLVSKQFTPEQKIKIIELLWSVAHADAKLDALEEHMVRKIADLIHVSQKDFIKAKHRVQDDLSRGS